ncbi:hypothetical protein TNCV_4791481 [Trichonephila clavipes]|nr:hypothetical protein TNCV_4791481 [Trichonephila clavipes]
MDDIPDIQRIESRLLNFVPKDNFLQSFRDIHSRFPGCIVPGGDYFEGKEEAEIAPTCQRWLVKFCLSDSSLKDHPRSGKSSVVSDEVFTKYDGG